MFERITPSVERENFSEYEDNEMIHEGSQVQFVFCVESLQARPHQIGDVDHEKFSFVS